MDRFSFRNQGTASFLVYEMNEEEVIDSLGLGMLSNNSIPGVLPVAFTQLDAERFFQYNISSKVNLHSYLAGMVSRKRLLSVFTTVSEAFLASEDYLLDNGMFLLDTNYMYTDVSSGNTQLVYLPVLRDVTPPDLGTFFKNMMFTIQSDPTENCTYLARILNFLNANENFSLKQFHQLLSDLSRENTGRAASTPVAAPLPVKHIPAAAQPQPVMQAPPPSPKAVPAAAYPVAFPQPAAKPVSPKSAKSKGWLSFGSKKKSPPVQQPRPPKAKKKGGLFYQDKKQKSAPAASFAIPGMESPACQAQQPIYTKPAPSPCPAAPKPASARYAASTAPAPSVPAQPFQSVPSIPAPIQSYAPHAAPAGDANAGTIVLNQGMQEAGTTLLSSDMLDGRPKAHVPLPFLIRKKTGEKVEITKTEFRLGKERNYADYCIADNPAVSRSHADILKKGDGYAIRDNNSLNHTYVDGHMLTSNVEYPLKAGSVIVLANEEFQFHLV